MPAPKGHPLWGNPIKPKLYTSEGLWDKFVEYTNWADKNPIMVPEQSKMPQRLPAGYNKETHGPIKNFLKQTISLPHTRAYSIEAFCNFANISLQTFYNYLKCENDKTYVEICTRIKQIIDAQHLEGGLAGTFNANIVAMKLGLKQQSELSGSIGITWNEQKTYDSEQETDDHN